MFEVSGRVAFVTGAASGIGRGMALALAEAGADVLLADVDVAGLDAVRDAIIGKGSGRAVTARLDVRDPDAWRSAADAAEAEFGKINILCSNAGVAAGNAPIEERTLADIDRLWDINARAMFIGVREILPRIRSHGEGGHIVITSSVAGTLAAPGILPYTMSKYAASALGETLYLELKGTNIGVSILCPGKVDTAIIANISRPTSGADAKGGAPTPSPLAGSASCDAAANSSPARFSCSPSTISRRSGSFAARSVARSATVRPGHSPSRAAIAATAGFHRTSQPPTSLRCWMASSVNASSVSKIPICCKVRSSAPRRRRDGLFQHNRVLPQLARMESCDRTGGGPCPHLPGR